MRRSRRDCQHCAERDQPLVQLDEAAEAGPVDSVDVAEVEDGVAGVDFNEPRVASTISPCAVTRRTLKSTRTSNVAGLRAMPERLRAGAHPTFPVRVNTTA
jgi:hypothetical protein